MMSGSMQERSSIMLTSTRGLGFICLNSGGEGRGGLNEVSCSGDRTGKYKNMRKWMVEFLRKSESRVKKIARVNK